MYVFCAIQLNGEDTNFGDAELAGSVRRLYTIRYEDSALVAADVPMQIYHPNKDNLMAHQHVISKVMALNDTVIPISFGNVFKSQEDASYLLKNLYPQFSALFPEIKGKIELGLKVIGKKEWLEKQILRHPQIAKAKQTVQQKSESAGYYDRIRLGELAQQFFTGLRQDIADKIYVPLKQLSTAAKANEPSGETMLLNASFLIDRDQEQEFDRQVNEVHEKWKDRVEFKYSGPWAAYNFVNIKLQLQPER